MFEASILWEEGCLAEQRGEYENARALLTESLARGLPIWWSHALPTLGWALIGLGEIEEARKYLQQVLQDAQAKELIPISLDALTALNYIDALQARNEQPHSVIRGRTRSELSAVFQHVYRHPAAAYETRDRIDRIAIELEVQDREFRSSPQPWQPQGAGSPILSGNDQSATLLTGRRRGELRQ